MQFHKGQRVRGTGYLVGTVHDPMPQFVAGSVSEAWDRKHGHLRIGVIWDGGDGKVTWPIATVVWRLDPEDDPAGNPTRCITRRCRHEGAHVRFCPYFKVAAATETQSDG
jgi:hypothetical protein